MEVRSLGGSGLRVSRLCLGTMLFGSQLDEQNSFAMLDVAAELGIDFIDLADEYPVPVGPPSWGRTEEIVGRWIRARKQHPVVATKCVDPVGLGPNDRGASRKHVTEACEASLRRLQVERLDIFYLHRPDPAVPVDETFEALDRLVQAGKVLYLGVSNHEAWHLALAQSAIAARRLCPIAVVQPRYNLLSRSPERDVLPLSRATDVGVVPYNPLAGGMLTGKYQRGEDPPSGSRFGREDIGQLYRSRYWSEGMFDVVETVVAVAKESGVSATQVALSWLLSRPEVTAPIVGASKPPQLIESAGALNITLAPEQIVRLDEVSQSFI